jgi:dTDP-4-dehydrorhamnose reductase
MRVLITGAGGLLAGAVAREFSGAGEVFALDRSRLDITDDRAIVCALADVQPSVLINCAAYNDVDGAEDDVQRALCVNALAVRTLARLARDAGIGFVHYSTDFVFGGDTDHPYREEDPPNPRGAYAASKLISEWFALEHDGSYVLRVESLFGPAGPGGTRQGSLAGIVSRIRAGDAVPVFVDRTVSPSYTVDVARATQRLIARNAAPGLYHCVNSGAATWAEIAAEAARLLNRRLDMVPLSLETAGLTARRPKYSALSNAKLQSTGISMPDWRDALARHLGISPSTP